MTTLDDLRKQFPVFNDLNDYDLADIWAGVKGQGKEITYYDFGLPDRNAPRGGGRAVADLGVKFAGGIPKAAGGLVGLGSYIPGEAGNLAARGAKGLSDAGQWLEEQLLSQQQLDKEQELGRIMQSQDGFIDSAKAAGGYLWDNPSQALYTAVGSLPSMAAGGVVSKGLKGAGALLGSPMARAAIGEGAVIAGSVGSDIANQNPDDYLARMHGLVAGAGGAALGMLGGKLMRGNDIDTIIANRMARDTIESNGPLSLLQSMPKRVGMGIVGEGVLEEAPQSALERSMTNLGTGKPWEQGLGAETVIGGAAGGLMGGVAGLRRPGGTYTTDERDQAYKVLTDETQPYQLREAAANYLQRIADRGQPTDLLQQQVGLAQMDANSMDAAWERQNQQRITAENAAYAKEAMAIQARQRQEWEDSRRERIMEELGKRQADPQTASLFTPPPPTAEAVGGARQSLAQILGQVAQQRQQGEALADEQDFQDLYNTESADLAWRRKGVEEAQQRAADFEKANRQADFTARSSAPDSGAVDLAVSQATEQNTAQEAVAAAKTPIANALQTKLGAVFAPAIAKAEAEVASYTAKAANATRLATTGKKTEKTIVAHRAAAQKNTELAQQAAERVAKLKAQQQAAVGSVAPPTDIAPIPAPASNTTPAPQIPQQVGVNAFGPNNGGVAPARVVIPKTEVKKGATNVANKDLPAGAVRKDAGKGSKSVVQTGTAGEVSNGKSVPAKTVPVAKAEQGKKTADEIEKDLEAILNDDEDLAATEKTSPGKIRGIVHLAQEVISDAVTQIRRKVGTSPGSAGRIANAARAVIEAHTAYSKLADNGDRANAVALEGDNKGEMGGLVIARATRRETARKEVGKAMEALRNEVKNVIGKGATEQSINAVVGLLKTRIQRDVSKQTPGNEELDNSLKRKDFHFSSAWTMHRNKEFGGMEVIGNTAIRHSKEVGKKKTQTRLEELLGKKEGEAGLDKLLHHAQTSGNFLEKQLAVALRRAGTKANVVISKDPLTKAYYDPNTNTIYLPDGASKEQIFHEALHAALHAFVTNNPNHPAVNNLYSAWEDIRNLKGEGVPTDVINAIRDAEKAGGKDGKRDAVLELISYGTTHRVFANWLAGRSDMQGAYSVEKDSGGPHNKGGAAQKAKRVWNAIRRIVSILLGNNNTLAGRVMNNTLLLLEAQEAEKASGSTGVPLKAAVTSGFPANGQPVTPAAIAQTEKIFSQAHIRSGTFYDAPLKGLFKAVGWDTLSSKTGTGFQEAKVAFDRMFPEAGKWARFVDEHFGHDQSIESAMKRAEAAEQHVKSEANQLADALQKLAPEDQQKVIDYLDGKGNTGLTDRNKAFADRFKSAFDQLLKDYADKVSVTDEERLAIKGQIRDATFSSLLRYIDKKSDASSHGFSALPIADWLGTHRASIEMSNVRAPNTNYEGAFHAVYENVKAATGKDEEVLAGFVHTSLVASHPKSTTQRIDASHQWFVRGADRLNKDNVIFSRNMGYKEAHKANSAMNHSIAIINTVAHLSKAVQSARFATGTEETGKAFGMVFDTREEVDAAAPWMKGGTIPSVTELSGMSLAEQSFLRRSDKWVQVPKDSVQYGQLAGKFVNGSIWAALTDYHHAKPLFNSPALGTIMSWFKANKTKWSPGTHVVNAGSNVGWMYLHDIPVKAVYDGIGLFYKATVTPEKLTEKETAVWDAFSKSGVLIADYSMAELGEFLSKTAVAGLKNNVGGVSLPGMTTAMMAYEKAKAHRMSQMTFKGAKTLDKFAQDLYSAEDSVFRLAAFMSQAATIEAAQGRGLTADELAKTAQQAKDEFLDYNIHARGVNIAKQSVLPFISWPYRAIPALVKIALYKPWKVAGLIGAYAALDALATAMAGGDDEDKRKRSKLPAYMNARVYGFGPHTYLQVPGLGSADKPVYFNLGAFLPGSDTMRGNDRSGFMGLNWWPGAISPNGPFVSAILGAVGGIDSFTGQPVGKTTDSQWEAFKARSQYLTDQITPPPLNTKKLSNAWDVVVNDKHGPLGAEYDKMYTLLPILGLRLQQVDLPAAASSQAKAVKAIEMEYKKEISKITKENRQYPGRDPAALREHKAALLDRMKDKIANVKNLED